jgi:hypothetical protein
MFSSSSLTINSGGTSFCRFNGSLACFNLALSWISCLEPDLEVSPDSSTSFDLILGVEGPFEYIFEDLRIGYLRSD